jgi:hypothetical protein
MALKAARYVGDHDVTLSTFGGPFFDAWGNLLTTRVITNGSTLLMPEEEVLGVSYLIDPRHIKDPIKIGSGRVLTPDLVGLTPEELEAAGWEFHAPRPDWVVMTAQELAAGPNGSV